MNKITKIEFNIYMYIWIISWFASIWTPVFYSKKLILTGLFGLILAILICIGSEKGDKDEENN